MLIRPWGYVIKSEVSQRWRIQAENLSNQPKGRTKSYGPGVRLPRVSEYMENRSSLGINFFFKHLYWSIVALQCSVSFCYITKWINYMYTYITISPPSCVSFPPSLSYPSKWSQSTDLFIHALNDKINW